MISSQLTAVLAGRYDPGGVRVVGGAVHGHRGRAGEKAAMIPRSEDALALGAESVRGERY